MNLENYTGIWTPSPQCVDMCNNLIENITYESSLMPFAMNIMFLGLIYFFIDSKHLNKIILIAIIYNVINIL